MSLFDSPLSADPVIADSRFTAAVAAAAEKRRDDEEQDPAP